MPGSIGFEVRDGVIDGLSDLFAGLAAFNGEARSELRLECSFSYNHMSNAAERVFTDRFRSTLTSAAMRAGRNVLDEAGEFDLRVRAVYVGGSPRDAAGRANDIATACVEWIGDRKNNELGITGLQTLTVSGDWVSSDAGGDRGHMCELAIPVRFTARIT